MTTILKATDTIANPKYGKLVPEPLSTVGLRVALDARTLSLTNGQAINNWVGSGSGTVLERAFNDKAGAGWSYPVFDDTTGRKAAKFNSSSMIMNQNNDITFLRQPLTYVVVGKIDDLASASGDQFRLIGGDSGDSNSGDTSTQYNSILRYSNSLRLLAGRANTGSTTNYSSVIPFSNDWFVLVAVFDGTNSKFLSTNNPSSIIPLSIASGGQDRFALGGAITPTPNSTALKGYVSYMAQYEKAMDDAEMLSTLQTLRSQFNI